MNFLAKAVAKHRLCFKNGRCLYVVKNNGRILYMLILCLNSKITYIIKKKYSNGIFSGWKIYGSYKQAFREALSYNLF